MKFTVLVFKTIRMSRFLILILLLSALDGLFSCAIEKRTFNRGYHVSWNRPLRTMTETTSVDEFAKEEIKATPETKDEELRASVPAEEQIEPASEDQPLSPESIESFESSSSEDQILAENPAASTDTVYYYPKFERNGVVSFSMGLGAIASTIVATTFGMYGFLFLAFLLLITGLILGISSLSRYEKSPEVYRTNVFGVLGVIINGLGLGLLVFAFVGLLLYFLTFG